MAHKAPGWKSVQCSVCHRSYYPWFSWKYVCLIVELNHLCVRLETMVSAFCSRSRWVEGREGRYPHELWPWSSSWRSSKAGGRSLVECLGRERGPGGRERVQVMARGHLGDITKEALFEKGPSESSELLPFHVEGVPLKIHSL